MKKIIYFLVIASFICSCSQRYESEAKAQMEKTMKELAKDPSSVQITNLKTMFANDSICVLQFNFSGKNGFGGVASDFIEYIYFTVKRKGKSTTYEKILNLSDGKKSIMENAKRQYQETEEKKWYSDDSYYGKLSKEDRKAYTIHSYATLMYSTFNPRIVKGDEAKANDMDEW